MMFGDIKRQDLFTIIRYTLYYAEMHSLHLEQRFPQRISFIGYLLELMWEIFLYFITIHIAILYMCTIYLNYYKGDLAFLVNCLMQTIIYLWAIFMKIYFRRLQPKLLEELIGFINLKYKTRSAIGFTYVTMDGSFAMSKLFIKIYVYISFMGCIFWIIVPIAYGDRSLPLACWYPFDYKQPVIYETMYFLQFIGQIQIAAAFCGSSGFHMVLSILISGQYDILFCSLKNILATVAVDRNATKSELRDLFKHQEFTKPERNEYFCSKEITCRIDTLVHIAKMKKRQDYRFIFPNPFKKSIKHQNTIMTQHQHFQLHFRNAFKKCVDHHRYIMECLNKMESFYSPIWFFKMGEVILAMCLLAFVSVKFTVVNTAAVEIVLLVQYLFLVTWELLIICYFGEIVYANSQRCAEALMRSPWYIHMREMRYDLLLFMLNSKRPFRLTAGKMYVLNSQLLKGMIKIAFSFLTLLQKMDERNE
ncbi:odorant receptor 83a-like [Cochliomyia hominivorax]